MARLRFHSLIIVGVAALWPAVTGTAAEPIPPGHFQQLHALIRPQSLEEKWTRIPWLTSLWEARTRAAAEGKPILLWEMDGHPLGCT